MSLTRSNLVGGASDLQIGAVTIPINDDGKFDIEAKTSDIISAMYGKIDESHEDALIKITGTPLIYDPATTPALLFPYLSMALGSIIPGATDVPAALLSNNGDIFQAVCGLITKMPDVTFGGDKFFGPMEITGIIGNGLEPEATGSYYTVTLAGAYTPLLIDKTKIPRGKYTWVYTGVAGMSTTPFEFQEPPTLTWDLKLEPVPVQKRTRAFRLVQLLAMLKGKPIGPTAVQLLAAAKLAQATGATHGHRSSLNAADLVGTGPMSVTVKNASLKSAGFVFGNQPIRPGEIGFFTTRDPSAGAPGPIVVFA